MDNLTTLVQSVNSLLWGMYCLIPLLVGTGIYLTIKLRFIQIRRFGQAFRKVFGGITLFGDKAGKDGMSSFQSLATAISAQVGTGNLAGVATAIAMGGPGAIFWMWLAAFFGMATIFAEATLAQVFRARDAHGQIMGGPAFYISRGLHNKPLAAFFAVSIIIALGFIGNMVQANSIADGFHKAFEIPQWATGIFVFAIAGFIFIGGVRRIASFAEKMVPLMAVVYILGSLTIIFSNYDMILPAFKEIIVGAFDPSAATGGIIGASLKEAIRYGVARGLFSNEAGSGSSPCAAAAAECDDPVKMGLVQALGVLIDTIVICSCSAFIMLLAPADLINGLEGMDLLQAAMSWHFGELGVIFIAVILWLFSFTTFIGILFYARSNVSYLFGDTWTAQTAYKILALIMMFVGGLTAYTFVWDLGDVGVGLMTVFNLIALIPMSKEALVSLRDYEAKYKKS